MKNSLNDSRYNIGLEYTGDRKQKFVLRFCGDYIDKFETIEAAEVGAVIHAGDHDRTVGEWQVVAKCRDVLWLLKPSKRGIIHRIAYGADVRNYEGDSGNTDAAEQFGFCVMHSAGGFWEVPGVCL